MHLTFYAIADSKVLSYTKIMKRFIYLLIQFTWGLGQTAIGFLFFMIHIARPHRIYRCSIETQWKDKWAGLSLGPFIFVPTNEDKDYQNGARIHEYGHTFQSLVLGPLYAIVGLKAVHIASIKKRFFSRARDVILSS